MNRLAAAGVFLACLILYLAFGQAAYWSDGRYLLGLMEQDRWVYKHVLYLPAAHLLHLVSGGILGLGLERSLLLLSALGGSSAAAMVFLAARAAGAGRLASVLGAALVATSPAVWMFSTCIEVHTLQLLAASGFTLWAVRAWRADGLVHGALASVIAFLVLSATHVTGVLWAPVLGLVASRSAARWSVHRRVLASVALLVLLVVSGILLVPRRGELLGQTVAEWQTFWNARFLWSQFLRPAGLLLLPGALLAVRVAGRRATDPFPWIASAVLALPFALYLPTLAIDELGAYYLSLYPLLGVGAALGIESLRSLRLPAAALLVAGNLTMAVGQVRVWDVDYPGAEWIPALVEEAGERGVLIAREKWEYGAVWSHTRMHVYLSRNERFGLDLATDPEFEMLASLVEEVRARGAKLAITRSLDVDPDPRSRALVRRLGERFGEPRTASCPDYLVYP